MRAVRDLFGELVQRRLWPIAVLLAVGLVAVPVVLAKHGAAPQVGPDAPPPPPAAIGAAPGASGGQSEPIVSAAASPDSGAPLRGQAKDPFVQQHVPPRVTSTSTATAAPGASGKPSGTTGGGSNPGSGGTAPAPRPKTYVYASVDVQFGRAGSPLREIKDVPRLAPLPSASHPIVIFMGTRSDHETAVFMLSTDVKAQGDGRCVPSTKTCEAIELRRDGVALLDVTADDGSVTQYELDLTDVALHTTTSRAIANAAFARASSAGRRLLHHSAATVSLARALRWSPSAGVLTATRLDWLQLDGSAPGDGAPRASAGSAPRAPVLEPLP
ncbi:MAG TPA: hypothetical protein VFU94_03930 [Conexibacter sp.]|nr:hypothetical protein [Conexibacter sp.]